MISWSKKYHIINILTTNNLISRNAAQHCSQHNRLELSAWRDESGAKAAERLSQDMVAAALEKAKQEMADRKKLEYMMWETRKSLFFTPGVKLLD